MPASENHSTLLGTHWTLSSAYSVTALEFKNFSENSTFMVYSKGDKGDCTIGAVDLHICTIGGFDLHHIFTDQDY